MRIRRTPTEVKKLYKDIVEYYFNNHDDNSFDSMSQRFKCDKTIIRKAISEELDKRFKKKQQCIKELED
jgi:ppGpp synthetase/RelA/SpoT-type nucleotidyltranferase